MSWGCRDALRHPAFWAALGVLVLNDHALKGANVLPGWLTGKLSDVAGLFVAPLVLAGVLGARRPASRFACFAAVAAVFSAIKLSREAADAWIAALSWVGLRWRVWCDPTDLFTLVAMPFAWWVARDAARDARPRSVASEPRRWAIERVALALGVLACAASDPDPAPGDWTGSAFIVNRGIGPIDLHLRYPSAQIWCEALPESPELAFAPALFDEDLTFQLEGGHSLPLDRDVLLGMAGGEPQTPPGPSAKPTPCEAVLVSAPGLRPTFVFWEAVAYETFPAVPETASSAASVVDLFTMGDVVRISSDPDVRLAAPSGGESPAACAGEVGRFQWSAPTGTFQGRLGAVTTLPGGCLDVVLTDSAPWPGGDAIEPIFEMALCIPEDAFPFEEGDDPVTVDVTGTGATERTLTMSEPPPSTKQLRVHSGHSSPPVYEGRWVVDCDGSRTDCNAFVVPAALELSIPGTTLRVAQGGEATIELAGAPRTRVVVGRAEAVAVAAVGCDPSRETTGMRGDVLTVTEGGSTP